MMQGARRTRRALVGAAVLSAGVAHLACTPAIHSATSEVTRPAATVSPAGRATHDLPGIHNLHRASDGVYSGGVPEGAAGFDSLQQLGIRTVISVDGAKPDLAAAAMRGMRYVHLPIGYDGVPGAQRPNLLRALRDLPGPIYIHCHHGQHRAPAATAYALVGLGRLSPAEGVAFLHAAGTSQHYTGLYDCVASARAVDAGWLAGLKPVFPSIASLPSIVAAMCEAGSIWERLKLVAQAGWTVPPDHPDLVPAAEAVLLAEAFREMQRDARMNAEPADFRLRMRRSEDDAWALADALRAGDAAASRRQYDQLSADCTACHSAYRDAGAPR
jgi:hypothetical protein